MISREVPMTEVEAIRVLQSFNMIVQKNERLEADLLDTQIKVEQLENRVTVLNAEMVQLKQERDVAIQKYLRATSLKIQEELTKQAME